MERQERTENRHNTGIHPRRTADHECRAHNYTIPFYLLFFVFASVTSAMGKAYSAGSLPLQAIAMQAMFTGMATGKLAEGSLLAGVRHAPALFIIGAVPYFLFSML